MCIENQCEKQGSLPDQRHTFRFRVFSLIALVAGWLGGFLIFTSAIAQAEPAQILLLRHAEKPESGPELSDRGWERAKALTRFLRERVEFLNGGRPAKLIAMAPADMSSSIRAIQTLRYVSSEFGITIESEYSRYEFAEMLGDVMRDPALNGKLVIICWERKQLADIANKLGVAPEPVYPKDRYDRAWLVESPGTNRVSFRDLPQRLLSGDSPF